MQRWFSKVWAVAAAGAATMGVAAGSAPPAMAAGGVGSAPIRVSLPDPAAAAILIDVNTGRSLYQSNAHTPLPPGSLTKTLTAMIAADWLPADAGIPVTAVAANAYPDRVGMTAGQTWPLGSVLHALITDSANDAAYALAVDIGGSLSGFGPVMQEAADQLGVSDHPILEDPAGLDGTEGFDGGNRISAWDLSIMGRDMMADPELAAIAGQLTYDFEGPGNIAYSLVSRNYNFLATYPGAIGVKTGYTDAAGYCDMEEAKRGGREMLAVVLNSTNPDADSAALLTAGFAVPVAAESSDPQLPAVRQPQPARASQPSPGAGGGAAHPAAAISPIRHGSGSDDLLEGLTLLGVIVGAAVWLRRLAAARRSTRAGRPASSPRTRPGGAKSRH